MLLDSEKFISPTKGILDLPLLMEEVISYLKERPELSYKLIIGTDSKKYKDISVYVSVILIHRIGRGGRYFWKKTIEKNDFSLKKRIFNEAFYSISLAKDFLNVLNLKLESLKMNKLKIEIHVDVGFNGPTKEMIKEIVAMVENNGFRAFIKPESYGASSVADRYT